MPQEIDKTLKVRFTDTIKELPQQMTDRLMGRVTETTFGGGSQEFDYGAQSDGYAQNYDIDKKVNRIAYLAPSLITRRERRKKFLWSNGFSLDDRTRLNKDTINHYSRVAMYSYNRFRTEFVLESAWSAQQNKSTAGTYGTGTYVPAAQRQVAFNTARNALVDLNLNHLIAAKTGFAVREVGMDSGGVNESTLTCALAPGHLDPLLKVNEIRSSDYASVKALVRGDVDTFMGFKFVYTGVARSKRLTNFVFKTNTNELDISKGSNAASAGSGNTKSSLTGEYIVFFHRDGLIRGPVEGSDDAQVGKDHELYGDQYMYVRKMDGTLRNVDACVYVLLGKTTTGDLYRVAPRADAQFGSAITAPTNN